MIGAAVGTIGRIVLGAVLSAVVLVGPILGAAIRAAVVGVAVGMIGKVGAPIGVV